ncbi:MAG: S1 family peptidase, partial [Verrucomicrobiales bacterium]
AERCGRWWQQMLARHPPNFRRLCLLLAALACALLSGCSTQKVLATLMESKAGSVGEWRDRTVNGAPLLESATLNTGLLLAPAEGLEVAASMGDEALELEFIFSGEMPSGHGSAVPVTRDGYFLTASHCLEGPRSALIVLDNRGRALRVIKTDWRVVWRSPNKRKLDLALIYAPVRLARAFKLIGAGDLASGEAVASAGWSGFIGGTPMASHAAGNVIGVSEKQGELPGPVWRVVGHDSPLHPGDSGGPLIDWQGRLIGIHSLIRVRRSRLLFGSSSMKGMGYVGDAIAPDPAWLYGLIEADRKAQ